MASSSWRFALSCLRFADDDAKHLHVIALAFGLGENLLDVVLDGGLVLFQALDPLDDGAQPALGRGVQDVGSGIEVGVVGHVRLRGIGPEGR